MTENLINALNRNLQTLTLVFLAALMLCSWMPMAQAQEQFGIASPPLPSSPDNFGGQTVITGAQFDNETLKIMANAPLEVKNQFTLTGPNRLVIDLGHAVLADKQMTNPMDVNSDNIRTIRLGQFDADTVRVVIQTRQPNGILLSYPNNNKNLLLLSSKPSQVLSSLPFTDQSVGTLQAINLVKQDNASVIQVSSTNLISKRVVRRGNDIEIDLFNLSCQPAMVTYNHEDFPEIEEIRVVPLNLQNTNTKILIRLQGAPLDMDSRISSDEKLLEISLSSKLSQAPSKGWPTIIFPTADAALPSITSVKKGSYSVVIDAGHGGKDLGANREGVYEKELNLSVVLRLRQILEAKGVTVYTTRNNDTFVPLPEICAITNRHHPDAFVSVHTNASVNTVSDGLETYYYTPQSRPLATLVHRRLVNGVNSPDRSIRTARFYVIHHTEIPAILCEMGYISNPAERALLQTPERQEATAEAIAQGVIDYLTQYVRPHATAVESTP